MKIEDAIQQPQFTNAQQRAGMNVIFTANWLSNQYAAALKPIGLSLQQLNVLTILKGQPGHTAPVNLIRDRLIDRMPNVSRLLNKLMEKGLVQKDRTLSDQRVVHIRLTAQGEQVAEQGRTLFQSVAYSLTDDQAQLLNDLLTQLQS
ncbi:MarR family winged helix-turn-helix transcriptional regulator [Hymenobacter crusticola]|uniref:MarR family transcriptional regulator n=1 Tax=Hymenobacter crusticola TaxID=1770526 RepID=A0A243WGE3_9BACT|nr:MarR family winged helix-turn-helix transcriptional regulator [Hymenobacter crusticola]OUJ74822.1 MarR family transcriptional regulator [Hymenobacter crusticola]